MAARGPANVLAQNLLDARLAHREERLGFVIHALDQRVHALSATREAVPAPLIAAIRDFQAELASVKAQRRSAEQHVAPHR